MAKLTKAQIEQARRKAQESLSAPASAPSSIVNPDPELEYRVLDLAISEGRLIAHRDRLDREGWIKLDTPPQVRGVNRAEVWAMPLSVYEETHWAAQVERDVQNRKRTKGKPMRFL